MTEAQAQKLVTVLVTAYPSAMLRLSADQQRETAATYRRMLADLEYAVANAAVERLLATSRYLPTIAEIREAAADLTGSGSRVGGEQWGSVRRAMASRGAHRTPGVDFVFNDPITARVVDALGWRELCLSDNPTADRARFIETYDKLAAEARRDVIAGALPAAKRLRELQARRSEAVGAGDAVGRVLRLMTGEGE